MNTLPDESDVSHKMQGVFYFDPVILTRQTVTHVQKRT